MSRSSLVIRRAIIALSVAALSLASAAALQVEAPSVVVGNQTVDASSDDGDWPW